MNVRLYRVVLCLVCGAILATPAPWVMLSAETATSAVHGGVTTVPATSLITMPANYFDLEGTTVTFTPDGTGKYSVEVGDLEWEDPGRGPTGAVSQMMHLYEDLPVDLSFPFPFADQTWTRVYANSNGNISFQRPERMNWPQRDPWADGSMRSIAAAVDSRSAAGLEAMIAVLWGIYGDTTISVDSTPAKVVITWRAARFSAPNAFYASLGDNVFQARLYPSGAIELAYRAVPERDGIVGLFHGRTVQGYTLDTLDDAVGDVEHTVLDITRVALVDRGSTVLATMTLADDVPDAVPDGAIEYRVHLSCGDIECPARVEGHGGRP